MKHAIKKNCLSHGLRPLLSQDYCYVEDMIAIAMLQNGQMPMFLNDDILNKIF